MCGERYSPCHYDGLNCGARARAPRRRRGVARPASEISNQRSTTVDLEGSMPSSCLVWCVLVHTSAAALSLPDSLRLDALLVSRGLCSARATAKAAIKAGNVCVDGVVVRKAAALFRPDCSVEVSDSGTPPYVSRAGEKLRAALEHFDIDVTDAEVLDIGASTGGFTDCVLQAGASSVVCVDCGHGQLHESLEADTRVTSFEGVNARTLEAGTLPRATYDLVVVDVSFISLKLVLPALWPLLDATSARSRLIALVKPQFEAGKAAVREGKGVVRDRSAHERVLSDVTAFAREELDSCAVLGEMPSPLLGGDGNKEFLVALAPAAFAHRRPAPADVASGAAGAVGDDPTVAAAAPALHDEEAPPLVAGIPPPVRVQRPKSAASRAAAYAQKKEVEKIKRSRPKSW